MDFGEPGGETSEPVCDAKVWEMQYIPLAHSLSVELAPGWLQHGGDTSEHLRLWPSAELLRVHPGPGPCLCLELPARRVCGSCRGAWRVSVAASWPLACCPRALTICVAVCFSSVNTDLCVCFFFLSLVCFSVCPY